MEFSMWLLGGLLIMLIVITILTARHSSVYWIGIAFLILTIILFISNTVSHWNTIKAFIDNKKH
jgi:hypothetical protein